MSIHRAARSPAHAALGGLSRAHKLDTPHLKELRKAGKLEDKLERLARALTEGPGRSGEARGRKYEAHKGDSLKELAELLKALGLPGSVDEILAQLKSLNPHLRDGLRPGESVRLPSPGGINGDSTFTPASSCPGPNLGGPTSAPMGPSAPAAPSAPEAPSSPVSGASGAAPVSDGMHAVGRDVPYISQLRPSGAEGGYTNGGMNCGPTSMAMIARGLGYGEGLTDAQLINHLGEIGGTTSQGTSVNGIVAMANAMGQNAQIHQGADVNWMMQQLSAGKQVVALGDFHAMPPHQNEARTSGHFITVTGMDAQGNFLVKDPADPNARVVSPEQMAHFLASHPAGGHQVAIG